MQRDARKLKIKIKTTTILTALLLQVVTAAYAQSLWTTLDLTETRNPVPLTNETVVKLVQNLKPAVVNISVTQVVKTGGMSQEFQAPFSEDDQFREFWKRFFGNQEPREFKKKGLGSGFIINREGYIVTNNHVIQKAKDITVILYNKEQYPAKVIGADAKTDIALIKIDAKKDLPVAPLGDSDKLMEGESVIAIGNPFGLSETVTTGIVSAKGRVIGAGPYDDFIQTDASINPGNSGGPLINFHGEVVGINTAIVAAAQGIGFAVPINISKEIILQLKEKGKVTRGWLGVTIQEVTSEIASSFSLKDTVGALVSDVVPGGPAEKAGLKRGDIILEMNGNTIKDYHDLPRKVSLMSPGEAVTFKVFREGKSSLISSVVGELKEEGEKVAQDVQTRLGISIQNVTPEIAAELKMKKAEGVVVTNVESGSLAGEAGMQRGDVILEVNREPINTVKEFNAIIQKSVKSVLFLMYRNGSTFYLSIKMAGE